MENIETTRMSSKGQVVIPEMIREKLGLKAGSKFVVLGDKDYVILKSIQPPSLDDLDEMLKRSRAAAKKAGLKKSDLKQIIEEVRSKK